MYVCADCGSVFAEPKRVIETHGLDTPPYEEYNACPDCYGMCIVETFTCDCCDEHIRDAYILVNNGERYCSDCYTSQNITES